MAKNQASQNAAAPEQPAVVGPDALVQVGDQTITVAQLLDDLDRVRGGNRVGRQQLEEKTRQVDELQAAIEEKNAQLVKQSDRIVELERANKESAAQIETLRAKAEKEPAIVPASTAKTPMERMRDGSLRLMITVPEDQAIPLLSWAHDAGEDPQTYIQKNVEEALVAVVSS